MNRASTSTIVLSAIAVGGALLFPQVTHAETITIDLVSLAPSSLTTVVNLDGNNQTGGAGQIGWDGSLAATGVNNPAPFNGSFDTYCIDLIHNIGFNTLYTYNLDPVASSATGIDAAQNDEIEELYGSHLADTFTSDDNKAAFQLALWNIIYDTDTSVSSGAGSFFAVSGFDSSAISTANSWLAEAANPANQGLDDTNLVALVGTSPTPDAQNQIFLLPGTMVPLPKPVLAGGALLTGLGLMQWKRRRTA